MKTHIHTECYVWKRSLTSFYTATKERTIIKLVHTNAFNSTRYNAKFKRSLTQQNACARLTLRVTNAHWMFASRFSRDESREKRDESRFKRDESHFSRVHWKYQYFTFVDIQTCFVYYRNDLRGGHDFQSHQRCVCTMCVL